MKVARQKERIRGAVSIKIIILVVIVLTVVGVALSGWVEIYSKYLEKSAPEIAFVEGQPRGVGISPVSIMLELKDWGAGLDEVVVRVRQRGVSKEVFRKYLNGVKDAKVSVDFAGDKSGLEEGLLTLEVKAFDRSFWSNAALQTIDLRVDYRKPRIEVLSAMHNTRRGGVQLLFYRATDEALAISGVRVGSHTFLGFPARSIDKDFEDASVYAVLYAIGLTESDNPAIKLFAQDTVGNAASTSFNNKVLGRPDRTQNITMTEDFLRGPVTDLVEANFSKIAARAQSAGRKLERKSEPGTKERLIENFQLIENEMRPFNDEQLIGLIRRAPHLERYWDGPFEQQNGPVNVGFGDKLHYRFENTTLSTVISKGFDFAMSKEGQVTAAQEGIVSFSQNLGVYGRVVGIDHGLGVTSIYGKLDSVSVNEGEVVSTGQEIGIAGRTGLARGTQAYYEMRLQGVAIDPREWWDRSWYYGHILEQIDSVKRALGMAILKPLEKRPL